MQQKYLIGEVSLFIGSRQQQDYLYNLAKNGSSSLFFLYNDIIDHKLPVMFFLVLMHVMNCKKKRKKKRFF